MTCLARAGTLVLMCLAWLAVFLPLGELMRRAFE